MKGLIFTYVMTYGGSAAALFNPYVGLLIYICFAIIKPDALWYWQEAEMPRFASRIIGVALLAGWVGRAFGDWRLGRAWPVVLSLVAFTAWTVVSTAQAYFPEVGTPFVEEKLKIVLPFLVGVTVIDSMAKLRLLAWVIVASSAYVSFEMNMVYLSGFNRAQELGFGGMDNNSFSVALNAVLGMAFFLGLYEKKWWLKAAAAVSALNIAHVIMLTFSRGGMLGLAVTAVATFLLLRKTWRHYLLVVAIALVLLRMAGPEVQKRFFSSFAEEGERDWSAESRFKLWRDCLDVANNHPIFGAGPRHFPRLAHNYGWPAGKEGHTLWLQVAAELGYVGLGLLLVFYGSCAWLLWRLIRGPDVPDEVRSMACMVIAALAGFAVSAQFVSLVGLEVPYYVALLGACTLKLTGRPQEEELPDQEAAAGLEPVPAGLGAGSWQPGPAEGFISGPSR